MHTRLTTIGAVIAVGILLAGILSFAGKALADVPGTTSPAIGTMAPDFNLPSTTGKKISLSQYRGKKMVLIEFYGADFAPT